MGSEIWDDEIAGECGWGFSDWNLLYEVGLGAGYA